VVGGIGLPPSANFALTHFCIVPAYKTQDSRRFPSGLLDEWEAGPHWTNPTIPVFVA
jgi:hypothetical protein